ncbi:unnamed protein product, partial [marine sediment metagenome]
SLNRYIKAFSAIQGTLKAFIMTGMGFSPFK